MQTDSKKTGEAASRPIKTNAKASLDGRASIKTPVLKPRPGGLRSARIRAVGDIMVCESQLMVCKEAGYDFHPEFEYIKDALSSADYTMGNLEGTVGKHDRWPFSRVCHQRKGRIPTGQRIKAQKAKIIYTYDVPKD